MIVMRGPLDRLLTTVLTATLLALPVPGLADVPDPAQGLYTNFAILVGFPSEGESSSGGELLVPGTVIPLDVYSKVDEDAMVERSLSYTRAVEKLWNTFRLDPGRKIQKGVFEDVVADRSLVLPAIPDSDVTITATLLSFDDSSGTYRIVFTQGPQDTQLADSTVTVTRGKRSVVGGMDGETAPYIFLFIEPMSLQTEVEPMRFKTDGGITEPAALRKTRPAYPEEARAGKITGVVVLDTVIDADGGVVDINTLRSPHPLLTESAIAAVSQWRFDPARTDDGKAVAVRYVLTIAYSLK